MSLRPNTLPPDAFRNGTDRPPTLDSSHPAIVEWRAITVTVLGIIHQRICEKLSVSPAQLTLAKVLEAATWKGGRELAKEKRKDGGPPIDVISDGTLF